MDQRRLGDSFRRPERPRQPATPAATPAATATAKPAREDSKYTLLLAAEDAATFDQLALDLRRVLGRRVAKAAIIRTLVVLAADDATIRDQLIQELRGDGIPS